MSLSCLLTWRADSPWADMERRIMPRIPVTRVFFVSQVRAEFLRFPTPANSGYATSSRPRGLGRPISTGVANEYRETVRKIQESMGVEGLLLNQKDSKRLAHNLWRTCEAGQWQTWTQNNCQECRQFAEQTLRLASPRK